MTHAQQPPSEVAPRPRVLLSLRQILPAIAVATFLPSFLLALVSLGTMLVRHERQSLDEIVAGVFFIMLVGVGIAGPVVIIAGLPVFLVANRAGWARPLVAILAGSLIGGLLPLVFGTYQLGSSALYAFFGAIDGFAFLWIVRARRPPLGVPPGKAVSI